MRTITVESLKRKMKILSRAISYTIIIFMLFGLTEPIVTTRDSFRADRVPGKIVDTMKKWRYIVSLQSKYKTFCSGVILSKKHVMTTCDCAKTVIGSNDVQIVGGSSYCNNTNLGQWTTPEETFTHPYCTSRPIYCSTAGLMYDYGLIRLATPFMYTEALSPIHVPSLRMKDFEEYILYHMLRSSTVTCEVAGWGETLIQFPGTYTVLSPVLRELKITLDTWDECDKKVCDDKSAIYCSSSVLLTGKLCARPKRAGNPCTSDKGGPLICEGHIIALVSHITSCGEYDLPNFYSRLDIALPFYREYYDYGASGVDRHQIKTHFMFLFCTWLAILCFVRTD